MTDSVSRFGGAVHTAGAPYRIYLSGTSYTFNDSLYLPNITAPTIIYDVNTRTRVTIGHPFHVSSAGVEFHNLTLTNDRIFDPGQQTYGGSLLIGLSGVLTLADSTVEDSAATNGGGGILNYGSLIVQRVRFLNNEAGGGAAIQNENGTVNITCATFQGNTGVGGTGGYGRAMLKTLYIEPGHPWENPFIERFIGTLKRECLDRYLFNTVAEAQYLIEQWREEYNRHRPHSSLCSVAKMAKA